MYQLARLDCIASNSGSNKMYLTPALGDNVRMGYLQVSTILLLLRGRLRGRKSEGSLKFTATIKPLEFPFPLVNEALELRGNFCNFRTRKILELLESSRMAATFGLFCWTLNLLLPSKLMDSSQCFLQCLIVPSDKICLYLTNSKVSQIQRYSSRRVNLRSFS